MPRGKAKPKAVDTQYFSLVKPEDLLDMLKDMVKAGYQGAISAHANQDGSEAWGIQITAQAPAVEYGPRSAPLTGYSAELGEVVVFDGNEPVSMSADEFAKRYTA